MKARPSSLACSGGSALGAEVLMWHWKSQPRVFLVLVHFEGLFWLIQSLPDKWQSFRLSPPAHSPTRWLSGYGQLYKGASHPCTATTHALLRPSSSLVLGAGWHIWPVGMVNRFSLTIWHVKTSISADFQLETKDFDLKSCFSWGPEVLLVQRSPQNLSNHFLGHLETSGCPNTLWRPWGARTTPPCLSFLPLSKILLWCHSLPGCRAFLETSNPNSA